MSDTSATMSCDISPSSPPATAFQLVNRANLSRVAAGRPLAMRFVLSLLTAFDHGRLDMHLPDGQMLRFEGAQAGPHADLRVRDQRFAERVLKGGDNGFAEAYISGQWDSSNVTAVLEVLCANIDALEAFLGGRPVLRLARYLQHLWRGNSKRQAKRNIRAHYDLGNTFYEAWLDPTMTYSSAIFSDGDHDLASAQRRKYQILAQAIDLRPEHRVLEIGCGWGGFAEYAAAEIGCRVSGLTISREQHDYAQGRLAKAGLAERTDIRFQDYRDETGRYDRIVSIEMFEAVGERYWKPYFSKLDSCLVNGGRAGIQVITIQDRFFQQYRRDIDFIRRHIFPGGMLPTGTIMEQLGARHGLPLMTQRLFALDYARTLAQWRKTFGQVWPQLTQLGFDHRFKRLWDYYLHYCEAGFRAGSIDVRQMVFAKP